MKNGKVGAFLSILFVASTLFLGNTHSTAAQSLAAPGSTKPGQDFVSITKNLSDESKAHLVDSFGRLPLAFEANQGQTDSRVTFLARGQGYTLFLMRSGESVLALQRPSGQEKTELSLAEPPAVLGMKLVGAAVSPQVAGLDQLSGHANYFVGNVSRINVPTFARVNFWEVYPGVDLVYYGNQQQLEYDFIVAPRANPQEIQLTFEGVQRLFLDSRGDLVLAINHKNIRFHKPVVYQEINGQRREIASSYVLKPHRQVSFRIAAYDSDRPLVIDPVLAYSTYLGGSLSDPGYAIAVDSSGSAYVTGLAASTNFPITPGAFQTSAPSTTGASNAFVTKLNPAGSALVYSTYLGGSGNQNCTQISPCTNGDQGTAIAVDAAGNAFVTGQTTSSNFPTTLGAFQPFIRGLQNAFVTKLNGDGTALLYSTYLGGGNADWGLGVDIDSQDNIYLTGATCSSDFPVTLFAFQSSFQATSNGVLGSQIRCVSNAFFTKLNPVLPGPLALAYSTYLGGASGDAAYGISVDSQGNAYVAGQAYSANFPITPLAFQTAFRGGPGISNAFLSKLNPAQSGAASLVYSTYLGGSGGDGAYSVALDSQDDAFVTGYTCSANFPVTPLAFQTTYPPASCPAFVTKFNPAGSGLVYSTYLGGNYSDNGLAIAVDGSGNAYITGTTASTNFPTTPDAFQSARSVSWTPFLTAMNPAGSALLYSTYFGGGYGQGIAVDNAGNVYITGWTNSSSFPTTAGAFQTSMGAPNGINAFVARFSGFPDPPPSSGPGAPRNRHPRPHPTPFTP